MIAAVQCMRHRFYDAAKRVPPDGIYDPARRMEKARCFLRRRAQMTAECWQENSYLQKLGIVLSDAVLERFHSDLEQAKDVQELLLAEARWAKRL